MSMANLKTERKKIIKKSVRLGHYLIALPFTTVENLMNTKTQKN